MYRLLPLGKSERVQAGGNWTGTRPPPLRACCHGGAGTACLRGSSTDLRHRRRRSAGQRIPAAAALGRRGGASGCALVRRCGRAASRLPQRNSGYPAVLRDPLCRPRRGAAGRLRLRSRRRALWWQLLPVGRGARRPGQVRLHGQPHQVRAGGTVDRTYSPRGVLLRGATTRPRLP